MKISQLFVYVAIEPDGQETIGAVKTSAGIWTLAAGSEEEVALMRHFAAFIAKKSGKRFELRRFEAVGDAEEVIEPRN